MRKFILASAALIGLVAAPAQAQVLGTIVNSVLGGRAYGYQPTYSYPRSYGYQPSYGYAYGYQPSYGYSYGYQPSYAYPYGTQPTYSRGYGYAYPSYNCRPRRHHRNGMTYYTRGC